MNPTLQNGPALGSSREVPLGEAERELRRMWTAIDEDSRHNDGEGMLRLREVNLVVLTEDSALERSRATAAQAVREHPGRVIMVTPGGTGLVASIATGCLLDPLSGRRVCSEEVIIRGGQTEEERLSSAILQLLVPEVPVVGWWTGEITRSAQSLPWLAGIADQVVTDLALRGDPAISLGMLTALLTDKPGLRLQDFEWLRVTPWRGLTAEIFEKPERRVLMPHIERLAITHTGAAMQALLYAAWFASRLGMQATGNEWSGGWRSAHITVERGVSEATVDPAPAAAAAAGPAAMEIVLKEGVLKETTPAERAPDVEAGGAASRPGLVDVRIHYGSGDIIFISRRPHSLACCSGPEEYPEEEVLISVGLADKEDYELLSLAIDTAVPDRSLVETLPVALELAKAPACPA